ncbi:MAG: Hsp20/alpha crystallin family protein [Phenylobacterium sp.]|uniref:Hsp20/alpha crystallin family protein n=1 Tax=Phenylobacterium sp. TaxID=1871053 RepID=UPI0039192B42
MDHKDLATQGANDRSPAAQSRQDWFGPAFDGFGAMAGLRDQMNRLFDSVFKDLTAQTSAVNWPSIAVQDKDGVYRISAELPGLDEKDVEVSLQDGVLIICGEKKAETEDKERHYSERYYGRFERRLSLGELDEEKITASFHNGVLTITAPKSPKAEAQAKRIPISTGQTVH